MDASRKWQVVEGTVSFKSGAVVGIRFSQLTGGRRADLRSTSALNEQMSWLAQGQAARSHGEAYLLDGEGADDVLRQGLCLNQADFNVPVDLRVIRPVSHTLHL